MDKITQFIESVFLGKIPLADAGTSPFGVTETLGVLGIPFVFKIDGSLDDLEKVLPDHKIIIVSEGKIWDPKNDNQTWGHVMVIVGQDGDDFLLCNPNSWEEGVTRMKKADFLGMWWYTPFHPCWIIG